MSEINFTWRASIGFTAAIRERLAQREEWWKVVVGNWNEQHPNQHAYGVSASALSFDPKITGFVDGERRKPPPEGLARAQSRPGELRPARGSIGNPWRSALEQLNTCPSLDQVFTDHKVPIYMLAGHRLCRLVIHDLGDHGVWLASAADVIGSVSEPVEHATVALLSAYYTAREGHLKTNNLEANPFKE
jgi:hypothetical protein